LFGGDEGHNIRKYVYTKKIFLNFDYVVLPGTWHDCGGLEIATMPRNLLSMDNAAMKLLGLHIFAVN